MKRVFGRLSGPSTVGGYFSGGNLTHSVVHLDEYTIVGNWNMVQDEGSAYVGMEFIH